MTRHALFVLVLLGGLSIGCGGSVATGAPEQEPGDGNSSEQPGDGYPSQEPTANTCEGDVFDTPDLGFSWGAVAGEDATAVLVSSDGLTLEHISQTDVLLVLRAAVLVLVLLLGVSAGARARAREGGL